MIVEKADYKTLRAFPYTVFAVLAATLFIMVSFALYSVLLVNGEVTFYQLTNGAYIVCYFLRYLSIVACFVCLYRLADLSKWINLACILCVCYMISELLSRVSKWLANVFKGSASVNLIALFINIIPTLFVMMVIVFMLNGICDIYKDMGKEKEGKSYRRIKPYWVMAEFIQMIISAVLTPLAYSLADSVALLPVGVVIIVCELLYVIVSLLIYLKVKGFCYEYYMYSYNSGR